MDRLRSWNLFLKYKFKMLKKRREEKKYKKDKEKEIKKNLQVSASGKYYSKPKVFGLTIIGLFLGIFESKADKQEKIKKVENKVYILEKKIDVLSFEEQTNLTNSIEKEIFELKSKNQFNGEIKLRIKTCEKKLETIKMKKNDVVSKQMYQQKENIETKNDESKENIKIDNKIGPNTLYNKRQGIYTPVLEIKVINKEIKDSHKKLKDINNKIITTTNYNSLYELEFSLKQLKIRFNDLLNRYSNLKELPGFSNLENILDIQDTDIYNLRFNESAINSRIQECNKYLNDIESKRSELLQKKDNKQEEEKIKEKKSEKKKESKKKESKKKEEKKIDEKLLEIRLANRIVLDSIANEKRNIVKFQRSINKMTIKNKKRSVFYYTKNLLSSIINFGLSLFPFSLFKNKFIAGLTSGIMLNNSLRSVRRVLNPEIDTIYILYSDFEQQLNNTSDYLNNMDYLCNDSLNQINNIRNTVYMQYGNDIEYSNLLIGYLKYLDNIEEQVLSQQETILNLQQQVSITKVRNKQKVKEWRIQS